MNSRIMLGLLLGFFSILANAATSSTTTTWQLPAGYYTPAKMPMTLVFPRPDSETNTWARQRIAYADGVMQYRIPISIQGGAYPFHYQLVSGPSGMAVGQDYGDTDYGVVTWTPAAGLKQGTSYPVDVKITDQEGNSVDATWSVKVNNNAFIFIDPNSTTNGTNTTAGTAGSKANPFNTLDAMKGDSTTVSPYTGKAIIFRGGVTPIGSGFTLGTSPAENPAVFLGYTGDIANKNYPTIDMSTGAFKNWGQPDTYFGQLKLTNADPNGISISGEKDTIMYFDWAQHNDDRVTFFENTFTNLQWLSSGGSNQAAMLFWATSPYRKYLTVVGNSIDNFSTAFIDTYTIQYAVMENNTLGSGAQSGEGGFYLKSDLLNITVRNNKSLSHDYSMGTFLVSMQEQNGSIGYGNIEICYNTFLSSSDKKTGVYGFQAQLSTNVYVYRNTLQGSLAGYDFGPYTAYIENNVYIGKYAPYPGNTSYPANINYALTNGTYKVVHATDITQSATGNLYGQPSDNYIDQNGALTGATASQYRGKVGAEIGAGYTPLSAPSWQ